MRFEEERRLARAGMAEALASVVRMRILDLKVDRADKRMLRAISARLSEAVEHDEEQWPARPLNVLYATTLGCITQLDELRDRVDADRIVLVDDAIAALRRAEDALNAAWARGVWPTL